MYKYIYIHTYIHIYIERERERERERAMRGSSGSEKNEGARWILEMEWRRAMMEWKEVGRECD